MNRDEYQEIYPGDRTRLGSANAKRMSELSRDLINVVHAFFISGERATVRYLQGEEPEEPLSTIFEKKFREWLNLAFEMSEMFHSIYDFRATYGYDPTKWDLPPGWKDELAQLQKMGIVDANGMTTSTRIPASIDLIPHDRAHA